MDKIREKSLGSFRGLAIGDAMGAPVEFKVKGSFPEVKNYQDSPRFGIIAGQWTDDTIMALCMAEAIIKENGYDSYSVMDQYLKWYKDGYNSPNGRVFDIGGQTSRALSEYNSFPAFVKKTDSAGNGVLMRLSPAVISTINLPTFESIAVFETSARDTHNSNEAAEATILLGLIIRNLINGNNIENSLKNSEKDIKEYFYTFNIPYSNVYERVANFTDADARNGGYVIPSLGTAIWALKTTNNFKDAVLKVVNLGKDSDTVAAITGQMAGALYGDNNIPSDFKKNLYRSNDFEILTDDLMKISKGLINTRIYG